MATKEAGKPISRRKQARLSRLIDRELDEKARAQSGIHKILIFGTNGSGRATFTRTMTYLHRPTPSSFQPAIASLHSLSLQAIKTLSDLSDLSDSEVIAAKKIIDTAPLDTAIDEKTGEYINKIWRDSNVQSTYQSQRWIRKGHIALEQMRRNHKLIITEIEEANEKLALFEAKIVNLILAYLLEQGAFVNCGYFLDRIRESTKSEFKPDLDLLIKTPLPSTSITELSVKSSIGECMFYDVSGQRNKTKKWIQCFGGISCIFFIASLNFYDECLENDPQTNKLHDSIEVFHDLINGNWAKKSGVVVLLNKLDMFREKMKETPFTVCFPDFKGKTADEAIDYVKERFQEKDDRKHDRTVFVYSMNASDKSSIETLWKAIAPMLGRPAKEHGLLM